jgi:ABC-type antimicrobial peptide transport system permease subunit
VLVGLGIAIAASRLIASLLYDVSPIDLLVYVAVSFVMLATAIGAALIPAARASRVDPMVALRSE